MLCDVPCRAGGLPRGPALVRLGGTQRVCQVSTLCPSPALLPCSSPMLGRLPVLGLPCVNRWLPTPPACQPCLARLPPCPWPALHPPALRPARPAASPSSPASATATARTATKAPPAARGRRPLGWGCAAGAAEGSSSAAPAPASSCLSPCSPACMHMQTRWPPRRLLTACSHQPALPACLQSLLTRMASQGRAAGSVHGGRCFARSPSTQQLALLVGGPAWCGGCSPAVQALPRPAALCGHATSLSCCQGPAPRPPWLLLLLLGCRRVAASGSAALPRCTVLESTGG